MTRTEREIEWATRNERRAATKDNAKRRRRKGKPGRKGCGTKKVAPGRKKTKASPQPTKVVRELMAARKDADVSLVVAAKTFYFNPTRQREAALCSFVRSLVTLLTTVPLVVDDPDWLGWVEAEAVRARDVLRRENLYPEEGG